jgi:hypothetical protein
MNQHDSKITLIVTQSIFHVNRLLKSKKIKKTVNNIDIASVGDKYVQQP